MRCRLSAGELARRCSLHAGVAATASARPRAHTCFYRMSIFYLVSRKEKREFSTQGAAGGTSRSQPHGRAHSSAHRLSRHIASIANRNPHSSRSAYRSPGIGAVPHSLHSRASGRLGTTARAANSTRLASLLNRLPHVALSSGRQPPEYNCGSSPSKPHRNLCT